MAPARGCQAELFAEKLLSAGFRDIEEYDEDGMTPLISACYLGSSSMVTFLLSHGVNPFKKHRDTDLRSGHFASYIFDDLFGFCFVFGTRPANDLPHDDEARLLEAAFQYSDRVDSKCRCSPEGFSPLTAIFRDAQGECSYYRKCALETMIGYLNPQRVDTARQWRCLVAMEVFDRLELTHTCIEASPIVRKFPKEDRLEIEEEEEELFHKFEYLMNDDDERQRDFAGDIADCVNLFFNALDHDLRPLQSRVRSPMFRDDGDANILGPGRKYQYYWRSSSGKEIGYGHKEEVKECYVLDSLFNQG